MPPLGSRSVRLASTIVPTFPGGGVGTLGPDIGGFFDGLWTSLSGAGVAAGAGTAATFTAALGELALILSLGGDTDQTRRGASAAAQQVSAQRVALDGAARRAYDFTHNPDGSLRQTAGSGILYAETGEPGPESMDDVNEILDRETRPGRSQPHREVETPEELEDVYEKVTRGGLVQPPPGGSTITSKVRLPDGTEVSWRGTSKSGGSTIDIKPAKGSNSDAIKVHLPKGYGK